ncbi:hypothetical protein WK24_27520 [Burkholderia vietnamiensis]|uniref:hypothetical protein n=1 Tax=Burkholderia vietnamiensis TaxID=60552 RepID=UPI000756277E|nr:hypothetical protein [Burkholderia vietnamiensis]KVR82480.1 hypothetical protein WK24_27520 [Burkholderia vietnamiensis]
MQKDEETIEQLDARLKREWEARQATERRERVRSGSCSAAEYAQIKAAMLADARDTLTRRPATEYPDVRGATDAEYQAARAKFVRGGR